ncbi:MAG: hypothetical protein ACFFC1_12615 [Promethearchaeota archaeon]
MNQIIVDLVFITISAISWNLYLELFKKYHGRISSVSNTAKYVPRWLFFVFIWLSIFPLVFLGGFSYWTIISGTTLTLVGSITGINPYIKENKVQDFLHILVCDGSIVCYAAGMIIIDIKSGQPLELLITLAIFVPVTIWCFLLWVFQVQHHTWRIERILHYTICLRWLIKLVIIPLIKLI